MASDPAPYREDRESQLLDGVIQAFSELGYEGASMAAIAGYTGVSRRTLYNRFTSKDALFEAAVRRIWSDVPTLDFAGDREDDPVTTLTRMGRMVSDFWASPQTLAFLRLVLRESDRFPELGQRFYEFGKGAALAGCRAYLESLAARADFNIPDAELALRQFIGLINEPVSWLRFLALGKEPAVTDRQHVVAEAVAVFCARYRTTG